MRVLVIGGTGKVGRPLVRELICRGVDVWVAVHSQERAALVPDPAAAIVLDFLQDPRGALSAFEGADAVYMLNRASTIETAEGTMAVLLAREARVGHFVYQSVHRLDELAYLPHVASKLAIQNALTTSGLSYTLICPNHFYQNDETVLGVLTEKGVYATPLGAIGCDGVDARDIAEAGAVALTQDGHAERIYALVGPERLTSQGAAAIWSEALGRPIRAAEGTEAWEEATRAFAPPWMHYDLSRMYKGFGERGLCGRPEDVEAVTALLGRPPRSYRDYVFEKAAEWTR
jgi:uncharacterized protein YbjT (DUF2867 family)